MTEERIRAAIESASNYLGEHPDDARAVDSVATASITDGLLAEVTGPNGERLQTDMVPSVGGTAAAPSPGWLMRAAIASCVATLIAMRAAQQGVSLTDLEVEVDSESDDRGILGIDPSVPAGPLTVRVRVRLTADEDDGTLRELAEWGIVHCPVWDAIERPIPITREITTS